MQDKHIVWLEHVTQWFIYVPQELQVLIPSVVYIVYPSFMQMLHIELKHDLQLGILVHKLQLIPYGVLVSP